MSARCVYWAFEQMPRVKDGTAIALLLKLADQANDDGICWPSRRTLAEHLGVKSRAISAAALRLEQLGLVERNPRLRANGSKTSNVYQLLLVAENKGDIVVGDNIGDLRSPEPTQKESSGGAAAKEIRDGIWDALVEATGITPATTGEKSRFGKSVNELIAAGATPSEMKARASRWPMKYPGAALTDRALANRWGELSGKRPSGSTAACPECQQEIPTAKLDAHRYDKHDVGTLCTGCARVISPGMEHTCQATHHV